MPPLTRRILIYLRDGYIQVALTIFIWISLGIFAPVLDGRPIILGPHTSTLYFLTLLGCAALMLAGIRRRRSHIRSN